MRSSQRLEEVRGRRSWCRGSQQAESGMSESRGQGAEEVMARKRSRRGGQRPNVLAEPCSQCPTHPTHLHVRLRAQTPVSSKGSPLAQHSAKPRSSCTFVPPASCPPFSPKHQPSESPSGAGPCLRLVTEPRGRRGRALGAEWALSLHSQT